MFPYREKVPLATRIIRQTLIKFVHIRLEQTRHQKTKFIASLPWLHKVIKHGLHWEPIRSTYFHIKAMLWPEHNFF